MEGAEVSPSTCQPAAPSALLYFPPSPGMLSPQGSQWLTLYFRILVQL